MSKIGYIAVPYLFLMFLALAIRAAIKRAGAREEPPMLFHRIRMTASIIHSSLARLAPGVSNGTGRGARVC